MNINFRSIPPFRSERTRDLLSCRPKLPLLINPRIKADCLLTAQNKPENEAHPYVGLPPIIGLKRTAFGRL